MCPDCTPHVFDLAMHHKQQKGGLVLLENPPEESPNPNSKHYVYEAILAAAVGVLGIGLCILCIQQHNVNHVAKKKGQSRDENVQAVNNEETVGEGELVSLPTEQDMRVALQIQSTRAFSRGLSWMSDDGSAAGSNRNRSTRGGQAILVTRRNSPNKQIPVARSPTYIRQYTSDMHNVKMLVDEKHRSSCITVPEKSASLVPPDLSPTEGRHWTSV